MGCGCGNPSKKPLWGPQGKEGGGLWACPRLQMASRFLPSPGVAWGLSPVPGLSLGDRVTRGHSTFPEVFCAHRRSLPVLAQRTGYPSCVRSTSGSAPGTPNHCGPQARIREPTQAVEPSLVQVPLRESILNQEWV